MLKKERGALLDIKNIAQDGFVLISKAGDVPPGLTRVYIATPSGSVSPRALLVYCWMFRPVILVVCPRI